MMMGTVLMFGLRMTRLSEMTVVKEMGKQSEPTFPLGWTNNGQDT